MGDRQYNSQTRSETYTVLLYRVMMAGACSKKVLFSTSVCRADNYWLIKKAFDQGHIRAGRYREKYGYRWLDKDFVYITGSGLAYLAEHPLLEWFKYLPRDLSKLSVFEDFHSDRVAFFVRKGNTLLQAMSAGAIHTDYIFTKEISTPSSELKNESAGDADITSQAEKEDDDFWEDEDLQDKDQTPLDETIVCLDEDGAGERSGPSLAEVMKSTYGIARSVGAILPPPKGAERYFFPRTEIKERIEAEQLDTNMRYSKIVGVLNGQQGTLVLYHARHDSISWNNTSELLDLRTVHIFSARCAPYNNFFTGEECAAILVYDKKNFMDILNNKWHMRSAGTIIGNRYLSVYLVPLGDDGAQLLTELLDHKATVQRSLAKGRELGLVDNGGADGRRFPLAHGTTKVFNGVPMDYKEISKAMRQIKKQTGEGADQKIGVLCYEWQRPYYETIWPNADYFLIEPPEDA